MSVLVNAYATVFSSEGSFIEGIQAAFRLDAARSLTGFLIALLA